MYRVMQAGRTSFYLEEYGPNLFGLNPKWRPVKSYNYGGAYIQYYRTAGEAQARADELIEFADGPKVVETT